MSDLAGRPRHARPLFGGSGSTLIGAEKTGRKAFLMELDPPYCDVIVQRYKHHARPRLWARRLDAATGEPLDLKTSDIVTLPTVQRDRIVQRLQRVLGAGPRLGVMNLRQ